MLRRNWWQLNFKEKLGLTQLLRGFNILTNFLSAVK